MLWSTAVVVAAGAGVRAGGGLAARGVEGPLVEEGGDHVEGDLGLVEGDHVAAVADGEEGEVVGLAVEAGDVASAEPGRRFCLREGPLARPVELLEATLDTDVVADEVRLAVVEEEADALVGGAVEEALERGDDAEAVLMLEVVVGRVGALLEALARLVDV